MKIPVRKVGESLMKIRSCHLLGHGGEALNCGGDTHGEHVELLVQGNSDSIEGLIPGGALKPIDVNVDITYDVTYWFPMLAGLSDLISNPRPEVRNCALEVLFDLLNERGSKFSSPFWRSIFHRVLFPIFDHVRDARKESLISSGDEWLHETKGRRERNRGGKVEESRSSSTGKARQPL
ncbi:hypothetical protein U1Q18_007851 [Sarracenia purpurea var. burkii]